MSRSCWRVHSEVLALHGRHGQDGMRPADRLRAGFGQPEVLHLTGLHEFLDGARDILDRHVRIDAMLIQQVDRVDAKPLERSLDGLLDVRRLAVRTDEPRAAVRLHLEPELRGDDDLPAERLERLADQVFIRVRAVDLGRVEERDAPFDGLSDERDHLLPVRGRTVGKAHAHAAQAEGRDFQVAFTECALLHWRLESAACRWCCVVDGARLELATSALRTRRSPS